MGAPLSIPRRVIRLSEYHKMIDAGVFYEDVRMELIEAELIQTTPIGGAHMQLVNLLAHMQYGQLAGAGVVSSQNPIALPPDSEPEPDIAVRRPECLRRKEVPQAQDVLLLIEIAATTLEYDRDVKILLYAKHAIPEVWIIDARAVTRYREPARTNCRRVLTPQQDETIGPLLLPNISLSLSDLWR